jgi:hypothetical protein
LAEERRKERLKAKLGRAKKLLAFRHRSQRQLSNFTSRTFNQHTKITSISATSSSIYFPTLNNRQNGPVL